MERPRPDIIDLEPREEDGRIVYQYESSGPDSPWRPTLGQRVRAWVILATALAVTVLFLVFFLSVLLYVVLPVTLLLLLLRWIRGLSRT